MNRLANCSASAASPRTTQVIHTMSPSTMPPINGNVRRAPKLSARATTAAVAGPGEITASR